MVMPASSSPATPQRVSLRSIERSMTLSDDHWFMVAHIMRVRGATEDLVRHAPSALLQTFNRHPRMRLRLVKESPTTGEIHPPFASVDELARHGLLHIKQVDDADVDTAVQAFVESHGQQSYDRYTQFAFQLHVWVHASSDRAHVVLFADHAYSDGASGNTILDDFLRFAAQMSQVSGLIAAVPALPLSPSLYEALLHGHSLAGPALRFVMQYGVRTLLRASPKFQSLLPHNDRQEQFRLVSPPKNPSFLLFATGTPENLDKIVAACRAEGTTFYGAFASAIFLSFIVLTDALENEAFKMTLAMNFDMRNRVPQPIAKDAVGCFITASEMPTPTINVPQQKFWDLARVLKAQTVETTASFPAIALPLIMMDQHFQRDGDATLPEQFPLPASTLADADVSSLGKYLHARRHAFSTGELEIEMLHYSGHVPFLGAASYFYATSLDQVGYSLSHHFEEATGKALFDTAVAIMEASWRVGSSDTLVDVATKLLPPKTSASERAAPMA